MSFAKYCTIPITALALLLVWLFIARPDRAAEIASIQSRLAAEADLRSQSLEFVSDHYRQTAVLLTRTSTVRAILEGSASPDDIDQLFSLQAQSGVEAVHIWRRGETRGIPDLTGAARLATNRRWQQGMALAFQGSLGRAFHLSDTGPGYYFFAPLFTGQYPVPAILIVKVNLGLLRDSWQVSANNISLVSASGEFWFDNAVAIDSDSISAERPSGPMAAVLRVTTARPPVFGPWLLRSLIIALLLLLGGVLMYSLIERRRILLELAQQREGEAQRLEREVHLRTRELEGMQQQLLMTEKLALLGQMSASISHEINQPLAAMKNYATSAQKLLARADTTRARSNLEQLEQLCDRVSRIVVNLRSFASNEPVPVKAIALPDVVDEATEEFYDRFPAARAFCHLSLNRDSRTLIMAGRVRLLQVLANLLTNAWYACRDQPTPRIDLQLDEQHPVIQIKVADNGSGIDESIDNVFDAFVSSRDDATGLGLGLTISRSFLQSMGGDLRLAHTSANGSCFVVDLQRHQSKPL